MNIKKFHFYSGVYITIFIALHLFNHLYSLFGAEAHIRMMDNLRLIYRNIFVEILLVFAVLVQIYSGFNLFRKRRKYATSFFPKLHIWSGLYLAFFFIMHMSAVFIGRSALNLDTNYYFGAAGLNTFPFYLFFIPYYGLAIMAFFGHISAIHYQKMKANLLGFSPASQSRLILGFGVVIMLLIFFGLTNQFQGIELPDEYLIMIGQ